MRTRGPSCKVLFDYAGQMDIPRLRRISSVDALPSTGLVFRIWMYSYRLKLRTFHYYLYLIDEAADNVESLRDSHLGLLGGESIEPIED
jgi:hypothetical protein